MGSGLYGGSSLSGHWPSGDLGQKGSVSDGSTLIKEAGRSMSSELVGLHIKTVLMSKLLGISRN